MKISIITSIYRSERYIKLWSTRIKLMARKLERSNLAFEFIAISNDPSPLEIKELKQLDQFPWFKLTIIPLESIYATWNRGVNQSSGEICTFWNVDDNRTLSGFMNGIDLFKNGADLVYFPFIYLRYVIFLNVSILVIVRKYTPPIFEKREFTKAMHNGPFFMFRRSLFSTIGEFDPSFQIAGDFEWSVRAAQKIKFDRSNVIAGFFRNDGRSLSGSKNAKHAAEIEKIREKYQKT